MKTRDDEKLATKLYDLCKENQGAWAKKHGYTRGYINAVCNGKRKMTKQIAAIIGYERMEKWEIR